MKLDIRNCKEDSKIYDQNIDYIKKNRDWYPKSAKTHLLLLLVQAISSAWGLQYRCKESYQASISSFENNYLNWSYDPRDTKRIGSFFIEKSKNDPKWIDSFVKDFRRASDDIRQHSREIYFSSSAKDLSSLYDITLESLNKSLASQSYGYITEAFLITKDSYWVTDYIKEIAPELSKNEIFDLLQPINKSFLQTYEEDLEKLSIEKDFNIFLEKWFWIKASYWVYSKLTIEKLQEDKKSLKSILDKKVDKKLIISKVKNKKDLKNFIHLVETCIAIQDERKENTLRINCTFYKIISQITDLVKDWTKEELLSFTPTELLDFLQGKIGWNYKEKIIKRNKKSAWVFTKEGYTLRTEKEAVDQIFLILEIEKTDILKGFCASLGKITGTARVILSEEDFSKVQEGDILITAMTRPEFMPVLKKAAAFVTNEGGITCHAAIVSREMNKPCVIGTRNATQVFKDGDRVEVDANNGIVRKIIYD